MRPGPPSETIPNPAPRFCEGNCPQECAPACYDWCCFNSVQAPMPSFTLMMVPENKPPAQPAAPAPLAYPMTIPMPCSLAPCSSKKTEVTNKTLALANVSVKNKIITNQAKEVNHTIS